VTAATHEAPRNGDAQHGLRRALGRAARALVTAPILLYGKVISPALPRRCRYEPTCSAYAIQAVRRYGVARGTVLAAWRLLRCNPFSDGGFDPVEAQRVFRSAPGREGAPR
jgi:putative membrane protein insertion efficiency factor